MRIRALLVLAFLAWLPRMPMSATRLLLEGLVKLRREDLARGTEVGKFLVRQLRVVRDLVPVFLGVVGVWLIASFTGGHALPSRTRVPAADWRQPGLLRSAGVCHHLAQRPIDARLPSPALRLEMGDHVRVEPQADKLLRRRLLGAARPPPRLVELREDLLERPRLLEVLRRPFRIVGDLVPVLLGVVGVWLIASFTGGHGLPSRTGVPAAD